MNQTIFWLLIERAMLRQQTLNKDNTIGTEDNPIRFGNVEFWKDLNNSWCYSLPVHQWNSLEITNNLAYWC